MRFLFYIAHVAYGNSRAQRILLFGVAIENSLDFVDLASILTEILRAGIEPQVYRDAVVERKKFSSVLSSMNRLGLSHQTPIEIKANILHKLLIFPLLVRGWRRERLLAGLF